jgi:hypothetical protein
VATHGIPTRPSSTDPIGNAATGKLYAFGIPGPRRRSHGTSSSSSGISRFDAIARGAQFRDLVAVVVNASPDVIVQALHEVTLRDMKLAWLLGELRYLPSRLAGRMPATDSTRPFLSMLLEGGTLVLRDDAPCEVVTGSAARLHHVHQAPQRFANLEDFEAFNDPDHGGCHTHAHEQWSFATRQRHWLGPDGSSRMSKARWSQAADMTCVSAGVGS